MSGGTKSDSSSGSEASYQDSVWGGQTPYLKSLYGAAQNLFGQTNQGMQGLIPGSVSGQQQIAQQAQPAWQNQMQGGVYQDMGLQNQLMTSLNQSMNQPSAMTDINAMIMGGEGNNYADAMREQYVNDANRAQQSMMSNLDARAVGSGMSGSSRQGVATARGMENINQNLQQNMANVGYQSFDKDLDRKLAIAQQADQGTFNRQQLMSNMLGQQQGTINTGIQGGINQQQMNLGQFAPYMMPWDAMSSYANAVGRPTILGSGSQSGSSDSSSMGFGK